MIDGFEFYDTAMDEMVQKYSDQVPEELVDIWKNQGLGTILNGYLKIINPDDYDEILKDSYFRGDVSVPIMVTAFGDIITFEEQKYVGIVEYRNGKFEIMMSDFSLFLRLLNDEDFQKDFFDLKLYEKAIAKYGKLSFDECFGFVPLLVLGGKKSVGSLKKVKTREHIVIITEIAGSI